MKYFEAFEVILDGGEAYREEYPGWRYRFDDFGLEESDGDGDWSNADDGCHFLKEDFTEDDWIVEKDGVVYKEYAVKLASNIFKTYNENIICPWCDSNQMIKLGDTLKHACVCATCGKMSNMVNMYVKDRTHEQDEPAELEGGKPVEPDNPLSISIDEDWLEKKVRCIIRKEQRQHIYVSYDYIKCGLKDCLFCYSDVSKQDKTQGTIVPADKVIIYICAHGSYPCKECYNG